jgi:actin related protein 2/3 complex subunit 3
LPLIPFKTKIDGPANINYPFQNVDIVEEGFQYFRVNVLFKNFEIKGPGDKILVYLFVFLSHLFKTLEQV